MTRPRSSGYRWLGTILTGLLLSPACFRGRDIATIVCGDDDHCPDGYWCKLDPGSSQGRCAPGTRDAAAEAGPNPGVDGAAAADTPLLIDGASALGGAPSQGGVTGGGGIPGTGGMIGIDGRIGTGGAAGTDVPLPSGGVSGTGGGRGGVPGTGGVPSTGAALGSGGVTARGGASGTGGSPSTGGVFGTGGILTTGGVTGTGATLGTGGTIGSGGLLITGGVMGTGGSIGTGGTTGAGGSTDCPALPPAPTGTTDAVAGSLITFNDNGAWMWFQDERVVVDPAANKLIVGSTAYGGSRSGNVEATIYDLATGTKQLATLSSGLSFPDEYNAPAFVIRKDGKYLATYAGHRSDCLSRYNIFDGSAWSIEQDFDWGPLGCPWGSNRISLANP